MCPICLVNTYHSIELTKSEGFQSFFDSRKPRVFSKNWEPPYTVGASISHYMYFIISVFLSQVQPNMIHTHIITFDKTLNTFNTNYKLQIE